MFGLIKNNIKTKIGIVLPASYPASRISHESVSVTGTGIKSYTTLLNELFALADTTKLGHGSYLQTDGANNAYRIIAPFTSSEASPMVFNYGRSVIDDQQNRLDLYAIRSTGSTFETVKGTSYTNKSNNNAPSGLKLTLYY